MRIDEFDVVVEFYSRWLALVGSIVAGLLTPRFESGLHGAYGCDGIMSLCSSMSHLIRACEGNQKSNSRS